jgi:hypothetical protein
MTLLYRSRLIATTVCLLALAAVPAVAQMPDLLSGQSSQEPVVTGAPYSADQITTVRLTVFGSNVEQKVVARMYRDSAGRIRREQTIGGFEAPRPSDMADLVVTIVDPVAGVMYTLNPATRTASRMPIDRSAAGAPSSPAREETMGTRDIDGIRAVGRRSVVTLPGGPTGAEPPVQISDERWESPNLRVVILAIHRDSRSGEFEQRLTNLRRAEPAAELFAIPANYTIADVPVPTIR